MKRRKPFFEFVSTPGFPHTGRTIACWLTNVVIFFATLINYGMCHLKKHRNPKTKISTPKKYLENDQIMETIIEKIKKNWKNILIIIVGLIVLMLLIDFHMTVKEIHRSLMFTHMEISKTEEAISRIADKIAPKQYYRNYKTIRYHSPQP